MEYLMMPDGKQRIRMNQILCITCYLGVIHIPVISDNKLFIAEWIAQNNVHFAVELTRMQSEFTDYLNRRGIPHED